jgi:hypothetical protein
MATPKIYPRLFTVEEANELLPVLKPVMERVSQRIELLRGRSRNAIRRDELDPESGDFMHKLQRDEGVAQAIKELQELVQEIHDLGCICKGVEEGLVDFPCFLGEEIVYLCWRYGEESVSHWHRVEDGFAGRRPLLDSGDSEAGGGRSYH